MMARANTTTTTLNNKTRRSSKTETTPHEWMIGRDVREVTLSQDPTVKGDSLKGTIAGQPPEKNATEEKTLRSMLLVSIAL
jgi:hypothetical protein